MKNIRFDRGNAAILYCIPKIGGDLACIIDIYTFVNRSAPPAFVDFQCCITRAIHIGCVMAIGDKFRLTGDWHDTIHAADQSAENEIESMLLFEEYLLSREWPVVRPEIVALSESEYNRILASVKY
ncbi:MAG TPA: hypothetical protein VH092_32105 [Urbifossiella sp.]|nr:hypothetical protein [Urbifossiella sp.]